MLLAPFLLPYRGNINDSTAAVARTAMPRLYEGLGDLLQELDITTPLGYVRKAPHYAEVARYTLK